MSGEQIADFIDEGIVGAAALVFLIVVVVPLSPFILIGWCFSRAAQAIEARRAETQGGSVHESAVPEGDAP